MAFDGLYKQTSIRHIRRMPQTVKIVFHIATVIRRLQDSHRIHRLCRSGGEFSVAKCNFAQENIHQPFSKKCLQHFFDTLEHPAYSPDAFFDPLFLLQRLDRLQIHIPPLTPGLELNLGIFLIPLHAHAGGIKALLRLPDLADGLGEIFLLKGLALKE